MGYVNDCEDGPPPPPTEYLDNGTFLVVRKLRQDVKALNTVSIPKVPVSRRSQGE